jgi:hypothetical protein
VLAVGIDLDGDVEAVITSVLEPGLDSAADAEVVREPDDVGAGVLGCLGRPVGRAVVDHDHLKAGLGGADLGNDTGDRVLLVEGGNDRDPPQRRDPRVDVRRARKRDLLALHPSERTGPCRKLPTCGRTATASSIAQGAVRGNSHRLIRPERTVGSSARCSLFAMSAVILAGGIGRRLRAAAQGGRKGSCVPERGGMTRQCHRRRAPAPAEPFERAPEVSAT